MHQNSLMRALQYVYPHTNFNIQKEIEGSNSKPSKSHIELYGKLTKLLPTMKSNNEIKL